MTKYKVYGMSCAACSARVERAVSKLDGVKSVSVNLLTGDMGVEGEIPPETVISAVIRAGYSAEPAAGAAKQTEKGRNPELRGMLARLIASAAFLAVLTYFTMGVMLGAPIPGFLGNPAAMGALQLILTGIIAVINRNYFISGFKSVFRLSPNMDALVALGASVAILYSTVVLIIAFGNKDCIPTYYFESAAMILTLITVGKTLEAYSKGKTTSALKALIKLTPKKALVIREGKERTISADELTVGDIFIVKTGDAIPADGRVIEFNGTVDESMLTGESIPADKTVGSEVYTATLVKNGYFTCRAEKVGGDTAFSKIIQTVSDAAATKAPIAKVADKVSGVFVPVVVGIALVTFIGWNIAGAGIGNALTHAVAVLVISCPCALGLATPVAITVGSGVGAKHGILFKNSAALEAAGRIKTVVLDKTGTLTEGKPSVTDVCAEDGERLLTVAAALEVKSEHPLGRAVVEYCRGAGVETLELRDFEVAPGRGLNGVLNGQRVFGGNSRYISGICEIPKKYSEFCEKYASEGKTPLLFADESGFSGVIAVADTLKADSREAVSKMKNMRLRVVMLTGDDKLTAEAVASSAGIDEVIAGVLPDEKADAVKRLCAEGKTVMIGDGINDAPALTVADLGIAIGAGTDVAIDAADAVLTGSKLTDAVSALRLGRKTLANIRENLFWAFFYNSVCIPLAAGALTPLTGWTMSPMIAAAAMSLSSFCVVMNALRLNSFKPTEEKGMKKVMKIDGMMCEHCEARVKKALEALDGVKSATPNHRKNTAVVLLERDVPDELLKSAVEAQDYTVKGIETQ